MCCCTGHRLNVRLKRKNPNRKREKEQERESGKKNGRQSCLEEPRCRRERECMTCVSQQLASPRSGMEPGVMQTTRNKNITLLTTQTRDERGRGTYELWSYPPVYTKAHQKCTCSFKCKIFLHFVCIFKKGHGMRNQVCLDL